MEVYENEKIFINCTILSTMMMTLIACGSDNATSDTDVKNPITDQTQVEVPVEPDTSVDIDTDTDVEIALNTDTEAGKEDTLMKILKYSMKMSQW